MSMDNQFRDVLDAYYLKRWQGVPGGTTVIMRALSLLRMLGFLRFDLFGVDSCWRGDAHHAFDQAENEADRRVRLKVHPTGHPEAARSFVCSPWHLQQLDDFLNTIRVNGDAFLLNIHGNGLLAYALQAGASIETSEETV